MIDSLSRIWDYVKILFDFLPSLNNLTILIACLFALTFGKILCPSLYQQHNELIGFILIISSSITLVRLMRTLKNTLENCYKTYTINRAKNKGQESILMALNNLSTDEESVIKTMVKSNRNNTVAFEEKYIKSLKRLFRQGLLCQRDIQESSIFELGDFPHWYNGFKMPDFVWEAAKKHPHFIEDDLPF